MGDRGYDRLVRDFGVDHYMHDLHAAYQAIFSGRQVPIGVPLADGGAA